MFKKFDIFSLFFLLLLIISTIALPLENYEKFKIKKVRMATTDMPHQPAVPPSLEKDIIHPTQSLLEISKKSTIPPHNIQTQLLSFV
ncbi:Hypothetical protein SRAE_2000344400 [Strongyloides ratti]|uniref:Uncharacterized protein n=1 Tax=Strongyloides ratti TaxID=34506 RepID=A0A090MZE4_STRRB|nr:Hypothetical protein SRAE_2000344400 [Strongyloides ratti]CEF68789.1 Hypothetical protein SRAE_2000344400 [Strongyloides ratti]